jgi:hypothetical protein
LCLEAVDLSLSILKEAVEKMMLRTVHLVKKFAEHLWRNLEKQ